MGGTITEKILSKSSKTRAIAGDLIWSNVNVLMTHDPCSPGVIGIFKKEFGEHARIWNKDAHVMIPDHFIFTTDERANANIQLMRSFAHEQGHKYFYDTKGEDYKGVCHIALAQEGHNRPGEVLVGTDSHTVTSGAFNTFAIGVGNTDAAFALGTGQILLKVPQTIKVEVNGEMHRYLSAKDLILMLLKELGASGATYQAIEFCGEVIDALSVEERMTLCNMVVEAGAKNGIMPINAATAEYVARRSEITDYEAVEADNDACYSRTIRYDVTGVLPQIAKPHSPDNVSCVSQIEGTKIDRAYIGSCTGGKTEDFLMAAKILMGRQVSIDTFGVPATRKVAEEIRKLTIDGTSIHDIMKNAGVHLTDSPSCAACCGGPIDTFGRVNGPMKVISTTNRNFRGRMGDKAAEIYLASPYAVAAAAIAGVIISPDKVA